MNMKRNIAGILAAGTIMLAAVPAHAAGTAAKASPSAWAAKDIQQAWEARILPSWAEGNYHAVMTRAQFAELAVLLYERLTGNKLAAPKQNPFRDTRSQYVVQAYELGIVKGTSRTAFSPNDPVTREQIAALLYNTLQQAKLAGQLQQGSLPAFADRAHIASWSLAAVEALAANDIVSGSKRSDKLWFMPKQTITVEEAAAMANRTYERFGASNVFDEAGLLRAVERGAPFAVKSDRIQKVYGKAQQIIDRIIKPDMSEFEKELAIHDYLVLNTAYDYDNYTKKTVPADSYQIYGALIKGKAVCEGYSSAAKLMLNMAGIEASVVTGKGKGVAHAWNKVKIDGQYYNLDVTWDDPAPDQAGRVSYSYFNVTDAQLRKDHSWTGSWPAAAAVKHNYFVFHKLVVSSKEELEARLAAAIGQRQDKLVVKREDVQEAKAADGLKEYIFKYKHVEKYSYILSAGGVLEISFQYR